MSTRRPAVRRALLLVVLTACGVASPAQAQRKTARTPPLPPTMLAEVTEFLEWTLQSPLSAVQKQEVEQALRAGWERGDRGDIHGTTELHRTRQRVWAMPLQKRESVRPDLERQIVGGLRKQPEHPAARVLLAAYEARHSVSAPPVALAAPPAPRAATPPAAAAEPPPTTTPRNGPAEPATTAPTSPPPPPGAAPASNRLHGLYMRTQVATFAYTSQLTRSYLFLLPDGRYILGLYPLEGLHGIDWSYWCGTQGRQCGTYELLPRIREKLQPVRLIGAAGNTSEILVARVREHYTPAAFDGLDRLDGLRLESRYAADCFNGYKASIQFTRDGRFAEQDFLGCVDWPSFRGGFFDDYDEFSRRKGLLESRPAGSGTYAIQQNTLELRYADGQVVRIGIHVPADAHRDPDPSEICPAERCLPRVR